MPRPLPVVPRLLLLVAIVSCASALTACKGGSVYLDTGSEPDDTAATDTDAPGCSAPVWRDRGTLGAEATGGYRDVAVGDEHIFVVDRDGPVYAVEREVLIGSRYGVSYKGEAAVTIGGPLERVQVFDDVLLLGRQSTSGTPGDISGEVIALPASDMHHELADDGVIANPEELGRLPLWGVRGTTHHPTAKTADVEADVTGDGATDVLVRAGGALLIFDGAVLAEMPADPARSELTEDQAWGVLEVCAGALPVDTAVFGTGAAGQGVLAVSCPPKGEADAVGSLHLYELPLIPPSASSAEELSPPNDITAENNAGSSMTSAGGGNLVTLGLGEALFVASPADGRVLELTALGAVSGPDDTLTQRYVFSPELPGQMERVGRFGASVALVRDGSGCVSLVVADPAYPLGSGAGDGAVYAVHVDHATATSAVWSAWRAPHDAQMTEPRHALGSTLAVSPDGAFLAVGSAIGADGWRTQLNVLSVE